MPLAMNAPASDEVAITPERQQGWTLAGTSAVMSVLGGLFLWYGITKGGAGGILLLLVGVVSLLFFGPATVYLLYQAVTERGPALVLSDRGFTDNSSALRAGFVAWDEVESVGAYPMGVTIRLRDPRAVLARQPAWRRALMKVNSKIASGDIFISVVSLPLQPEELLRLINEKWSRTSGTPPADR